MKNILVLLLVSSFLTIITTPTFAYVPEEHAGIGAYNEERPLDGDGLAEERRDRVMDGNAPLVGERRPLVAAAVINNENAEVVNEGPVTVAQEEAVEGDDTPVPAADAKASDKGEFSGEF